LHGLNLCDLSRTVSILILSSGIWGSTPEPYTTHLLLRRLTITSRLQPSRLNLATIGFAALLAGCGTEPSPHLAGAWSVTASFAGGGSTCTVLATLTLDDSGPSLSGSFAEHQVTCTTDGPPRAFTPDTTTIIGTADGRGLSFTPQPPEGESSCSLLRFEGEAAEDRMSGTVGTIPVFCQGIYVQMNGSWEAQRS
jgi:hypothetical protein